MMLPFLKEKITPENRLHLFGVLATLLLAGLAYGPAISGPFFFDDEHFILRNASIQSLANIPEIYRTTVTQSAHISGNFYRPNQQLIYSLLYQVFGTTTSVPYHLTSIFLHITNTFLLVGWLGVLGLSWPIAWISGLFFLTHPVQTEAVAYISGLADPLGLCFMLIGLIVYTRSLRATTAGHQASNLLSLVFVPAVCALCAMTTKENGVVFLPLLLLTSVSIATLLKKPLPRRAWLGLMVVALLTVTYLALKFTVFNFTKTIGLTDEVNAYTEDLWLRLTTFVHVIWDYAVLIVAPIDLFYEKPYTAYPGLEHPRAWFGLTLLVLSGITLLRVKQNPRLTLGVAVFWAGLLPYVGVIPVNAMYLEHWLYVPLIGFSLIIASLATSLERTRFAVGRKRQGAALVLIVLFLTMTYKTHTRAAEWADPERFYLNEIAHGSVATRTYNNLGLYYADKNQPDQAAKYWQLAADSATSRPFPQPHHNLARYYFEHGNFQEGIHRLHLALKADHDFVYSLALLQEIFTRLGDQEKSLALTTAMEKVLRGESYDFASLEKKVFSENNAVH